MLFLKLSYALKAVPGRVIVIISACGSGAGIYAASYNDAQLEESFDIDAFNDGILDTFARYDESVEEVSAQTGELRVSGKFYVLTSSGHRETTWSNNTYGGIFIQGITAGVPTAGTMPADSSGGGSISGAVNGIREAVEKGVTLINLSLSAGSLSPALDDAVLDALHAGITVVAAAGNASRDTAALSPAHLTDAGVLVVGAAAEDGSLAHYSNYGSSVDVYAYGSNILCCANDGGYTEQEGTSIAAPHVTALAALLTLTHGELAPEEIETRIRRATDEADAVNIPALRRIIPANPGFSLSLLKLDLQDRVRMPAFARPAAAMEPIVYKTGDSRVVTVSDGVLTPVGPGRALVTARCLGMPDMSFTVEVSAEPCTHAVLPQALEEIGDDAFLGCASLAHVTLPPACRSLAGGAFAQCPALRTLVLSGPLEALPDSLGDAVVLCPENEELEASLRARQLPCIAEPEEHKNDAILENNH
ncbi:MAG: S8 family serine peptidase [Oscillospiraceae bacterium]|nr:S8 family serine peptidase [Oscillospiraceae bacterium]